MPIPESNPIYSFGSSTYDETTLIASPSYPNSICWSDENLLAVASGKLITILNPASLNGPRGLITLSQHKPFPKGVVDREDLLRPCLMPICLSRNTDPCVRSISWSPSGFSPSGGCLLAVCTSGGHVKLYRSPYVEFGSEWIETGDVSQLLYEYHASANFAETGDVSQLLYEYHASTNFAEADNVILPIHQENEVESEAGFTNGTKLRRKRNVKRFRSEEASSGFVHHIKPEQYASRSATLSSMVVAWSPVLQCLKNVESPAKCTILSIGAKSGDISFWRICVPEHYSVARATISVHTELVGVLEAHDSWVSAITWGLSTASSCNSQVILATGSSDGSVKLWSTDLEVIQVTTANKQPFCLLVTINGSGPVSAISLFTMANSHNKAVLAIGRGSGSIEVWTYDLSSNQLINAGTYHSHSQMVMGLTFSFNGQCLYSCSQDNSVCSWLFDGNRLHETNFPSDITGNHNPANISKFSDLCFGIATSPGEMMVAVVRNLDIKLLNPMYQAGTQKAVIELLYTRGQNLEIMKQPLDSSNYCLAYWDSNILSSLKKYENYEKDLVLWDIIVVLLSLEKSNPRLVENLLCKWISEWFSDIHQVKSLESMLSHMRTRVFSMDTRKLHLVCVICRRFINTNTKSDNERQMWHDLLVACEKELRERLVGLTFTRVLQASKSCVESMCTELVGVGQMVQWVSSCDGEANNWLKNLLSKINKLKDRIKSLCQYTTEEQCSFCSEPVQFESPEIAWCSGNNLTGESSETHKLSRCAVSMQLCPILDPVWFCICCERCVDRLPPQSFFSISGSTFNVSCENMPLGTEGPNVPLCPFCGIMLQKQLPDFLLSINPV